MCPGWSCSPAHPASPGCTRSSDPCPRISVLPVTGTLELTQKVLGWSLLPSLKLISPFLFFPQLLTNHMRQGYRCNMRLKAEPHPGQEIPKAVAQFISSPADAPRVTSLPVRRGAGGGHELQGPPAPRNLPRTRCPDSPPAPRAVTLALSWAWFPLPLLMLCPECVPLQLDCSHQIQICFLPRPSDRPLLDSLYTDRPSRQVSAQPPLSVTQHPGPMLSSAGRQTPCLTPSPWYSPQLPPQSLLSCGLNTVHAA